LGEQEVEKYWNSVALESKVFEKALRLEKWKKTARNWLADYADKRARDFFLTVVNEVALLGSSAKVLDVGCGPGKWLTLLAKKYSSVTAIDISKNMISLAKEKAQQENLGNIDFWVMNVSSLDFPDETYDLVNCVTVLQHMQDKNAWKIAIHEIVRVTKRGGYILLFEVAPNFGFARRTLHLSLRSMRQYTEEFEKVGTHLVYWRAVDLSLPITYFGLRNYAASFNKRVYYFASEGKLLSSGLLSFLSWTTALLARVIDYKLAETPLSFLSLGRILLFQKG
jgi:ubiquinone/menaquinone biosynthesis C-methylase UbiE